jgi:hypothetical protein
MSAEATAAGYLVQLSVAARGQSDGPGGYGVVLISGQHHKALSGGFARTTVPRLELHTLKRVSALTIVCQSDYAANGLNGQAVTWQALGWRREDEPIPNADLWAQLLPLAACEPEAGHLGPSARVVEASTYRLPKAWTGPQLIIEVTTYDATDEADVWRIRQAIRDLGITAALTYLPQQRPVSKLPSAPRMRNRSLFD